MFGIGEEFTILDYVGSGRAIHHTITSKKAYDAIRNGIRTGFVRQVGWGGVSWYDGMATVQRWIVMMRGKSVLHARGKRLHGTISTYASLLGGFNEWVARHEYESPPENGGSHARVRFHTVEDLAIYLEDSSASPRPVQKIVMDYLHDPIHEKKKAGSMNNIRSAILSYFSAQEIELRIRFKSRKRHESEPAEKIMSLADLGLILNRMNARNKAIFLCKFQRGLDSSTLVNKFNYKAWGQLVEWFGSPICEEWDLKKCPVPITLVRIKTDYRHTGFLDADAVAALIQWLQERKRQMGSDIGRNDPIFTTQKRIAIGIDTIHMIFTTAARSAGILKKIGTTSSGKTLWNMAPHETRDLLKSVLLDSGCRYDVADHVIGHRPKDSYEKQAALFQDSLRTEYAKASKRLNVMTNMANHIMGNGNAGMRELLAEERKRTERFILDVTGDTNDGVQKVALDRHARMLEQIAERIGGLEPATPLHKDVEYECAKCGIIHRDKACPGCGSAARRIWDSSRLYS